MNARSMRKRKENVCNSIISNFCGDFFQEKKIVRTVVVI